MMLRARIANKFLKLAKLFSPFEIEIVHHWVVNQVTHAPRRLLPSHPDYQNLNNLQTLLHVAVNAHMYPFHNDIDPLMLPVVIANLKEHIGNVMDEGNFQEVIQS